MSKQNKTHWKTYFNSDYLGCQDLDHDKDLVATIAKVEEKELNIPGTGKTENKAVLFFKESVKPMVLNVTNSRNVAALAASNYVEDWQGLTVAIYIDPNVRFGRDTVEGLRIRLKKVKPLEKPKVESKEQSPQLWANCVSGRLKGRDWKAIDAHYNVTDAAKKAIDKEVEAEKEKQFDKVKATA